MNRFGLLGHPLGHSWSPAIHSFFGDYEYELYDVEPGDLTSFLSETDLDGMNVTIPYKKKVMPFCVSLSETARRIGSVNTLIRTNDGWFGGNTDYEGFIALFQSTGMSAAGRKALVFGSGGASVSVIEALKDLGASPIVNISRHGADNYQNLSRHSDAEILVNTTSLGMYPDVESAPVSPSSFPACRCVLDIVYNPSNTSLLLDAQRHGIRSAGGLLMLVAQARRSAELFTGAAIPDEMVWDVTDILRRRQQNIILIGMPGCGKSTAGKLLAEQLSRPFIDTDALIVERTGRDIPSIFAEEGEAGFRRMESEILKETCSGSGAVIATGGGCVTVSGNYDHLHRNGIVFWLKRSTELLPVDGRPLSQRTPLETMYREREPLYRQFADHEIDNNGSITDTVKSIREVFDR